MGTQLLWPVGHDDKKIPEVTGGSCKLSPKLASLRALQSAVRPQIGKELFCRHCDRSEAIFRFKIKCLEIAASLRSFMPCGYRNDASFGLSLQLPPVISGIFLSS